MDAPVLLSFVALQKSGRDMAVALRVTGGYVVPALDLSVFTGLRFRVGDTASNQWVSAP